MIKMMQTETNAIRDCRIDIEREQALFTIVSDIRRSLDLDMIVQTTIQSIRQMLAVDRVGVVRLNALSGWDEGEFVAETVLPRFDSVLAERVKDHCFGEQYADAYRNGRIHAVDDIYDAGLSDCHIEILSRFQVRANLLVPLLQGEELWGLLCIHQCSGPRRWQDDEIDFVSTIAVHLSVAIQHAELLARTQRQTIELNETIRALKSAQVQLAETEKMAGLGQLAAGVAHEINNPVNFIKGNLQHAEYYLNDLVDLVNLYGEHCPSGITSIESALEEIDIEFLKQDLSKLFGSMSIGVTRIRDIVRALRHFSRVDEVGLKQVDLHDSLEDTLLLLKNRLQATDYRPEIRVCKCFDSSASIECYPGKMNQTLMNLLTNAVDAFDELWLDANLKPTNEPMITIRTQASSDKLLITLEDNGPGMSETVKAKLYDPFFTTKPVGQGTGLGLAIAYQIISQHRGLMECRSEIGIGTQFSIELPIEQNLSQLANASPELLTDR